MVFLKYKIDLTNAARKARRICGLIKVSLLVSEE
jgi:hypothetical protein